MGWEQGPGKTFCGKIEEKKEEEEPPSLGTTMM